MSRFISHSFSFLIPLSLAGWWGNDASTRFHMSPNFQPTPGAKGYQHSCTPVLSSIPLLATLQLIEAAGFSSMVEKGRRLTGSLEALLKASRYYVHPADPKGKIGFRIITPAAPYRGTQLSLVIMPEEEHVMPNVFDRMLRMGLVGDERRPSVIRLSPVVLYNTFEEVGRAVEIVEEALREEEEERKR